MMQRLIRRALAIVVGVLLLCLQAVALIDEGNHVEHPIRGASSLDFSPEG